MATTDFHTRTRKPPPQKKKQQKQKKQKKQGNGAAPPLVPDRAQIESFVGALFRYAGNDGYVSIRSFFDDDSTKSFSIRTAHLRKGGLNHVIGLAVNEAKRAANATKIVVFSPPIAVLNNPNKWQARQEDLLLGLALSVECDQHTESARERLERLLGPVTVAVASGGEWIDPETGEVQPKLHLHWRLRKPADQTTLADLKTARNTATKLVGGDPSNTPIVHPIRWPGSWHRKKTPKLCTIVTLNADAEIDLNTALAALKNAAGNSSNNGEARSLNWAEEYAKEDSYTALGDEQNPAPNWGELINNIRTAEFYHESLNKLAAKMITAGMDARAVANMLRGLMEASEGPRDSRWQARYNDIDRSVSTAWEKYGEEQKQPQGKPVEPVDLWAKREGPPLPKGLLPPIIEEYAFKRSEIMGCDPSGLAMAALTVCSTAIPDMIKLQTKQHDRTWTESTRIWVALGGPVSAIKSAIIRETARPITEIDKRLSAAYRQAKAEYDELPKGEKGDKPRHRRIRIEDATPEALQPILQDSPDGVLLVRDELSGWFGAMDKYSGHRGAAADRGFWLTAFNGGYYSVDRIARGSNAIENLSINLLGGIQESTLRKVVEDNVDDGLIQRLFVVMLRPAVVGKDEPGMLNDDDYYKLVEKLHNMPREVCPEHFDAKAQVIRRQLEQRHIELIETYNKINKKLAAHIGKYNGLFVRLCLLWHVIENIDEKWPAYVNANTARRVADFLHGFLLEHAIAFYVHMLGLSDQHDRLQNVAEYILAHKLERVTNRDVQRGDRSMRGLEKADIESIFQQLDAMGWITPEHGRRHGDVRWNVNPEVHRKWAAKAKEEAERRTKQRAEIIAGENVARRRGEKATKRRG